MPIYHEVLSLLKYLNMNINAKNYKIGDQSINNVYSFTSFSGNTNVIFNSNSTCCADERVVSAIQNQWKFYTINLDWFQFVCKTKISGYALESCSSKRIKVRRTQTHNTSNYRFKYIVTLDGCEICEIFSQPNNTYQEYDDVSIKVNNAQLYCKDWVSRIKDVMNLLDFEFIRMTRIDIALDGGDLLKKMRIIDKFMVSQTVQTNSDNLSINPLKFRKHELKYDGFRIGDKAYQKTLIIYNKSDEILNKSGKTYISEFWQENGIDTNRKNGRCELYMGCRHLKKYQLSSFDDFCNPEFLGRLFYDEVHDWSKFYHVRLKDYTKYRKSIAIKKGRELTFIHWNRLPKTSTPLVTYTSEPNDICNAKRAVTFSLKEILKNKNCTSTENKIRFIQDTTIEHNLFKDTNAKINDILKNEPTENDAIRFLLDWITEQVAINNGGGDAGITLTE